MHGWRYHTYLISNCTDWQDAVKSSYDRSLRIVVGLAVVGSGKSCGDEESNLASKMCNREDCDLGDCEGALKARFLVVSERMIIYGIDKN